MRRCFIVMALLAAFGVSIAPSWAQFVTPEGEKVEKSAADQVDRQYKATLDKTRKEVAAPPTDPWSNMRSPTPAKPKR